MGKVRAAVQHYDMIDEGDQVAVGVSGGKDSLFLLCALAELSRYYPQKIHRCRHYGGPLLWGRTHGLLRHPAAVREPLGPLYH